MVFIRKNLKLFHHRVFLDLKDLEEDQDQVDQLDQLVNQVQEVREDLQVNWVNQDRQDDLVLKDHGVEMVLRVLLGNLVHQANKVYQV